MIFDHAASDPAFQDGGLPKVDVPALVADTQSRLGNGEPWRLISARKKLGKTLFEVEAGERRLIGIGGKAARMEHAFTSLEQAWSGGMRPPRLYTVVEPVGCLPDLCVMVMERAPGDLLWPMIERGSESALEGVEDAARWLATLHALPLNAPVWEEDGHRLDKWQEQLSEVLPAETERIRALHDAIRSRAGRTTDLVPSHGDFHAGNVFVDHGKRITVIDLDKFGMRERAFDVAYCMVQMACMGFWARGDFARTEPVRARFLAAYEQSARVKVDRERMSLTMGATLLQNLNYDLSVFKTGRVEIAPAFLSMAERCVFEGDVELRAEAAAAL